MDEIKNDWGLSRIEARRKQPKITKKEALEFLPEFKRLWHRLGQIHLRLYGGIEYNQPIYMTKPEALEAVRDVIDGLTEICDKYFK